MTTSHLPSITNVRFEANVKGVNSANEPKQVQIISNSTEEAHDKNTGLCRPPGRISDKI